ncbi:hypothetical protein AVEN_164516-1 [Araneus ventricosus]|uniref:Uncharacterized protein n=1 Tax=Araneus ventricosus TaxID=182803 RepID=A0A4Y2B4V9_ARAVE|nr:hypothetical protein AVEN_164516-1 [Araneus ventricosus]
MPQSNENWLCEVEMFGFTSGALGYKTEIRSRVRGSYTLSQKRNPQNGAGGVMFSRESGRIVKHSSPKKLKRPVVTFAWTLHEGPTKIDGLKTGIVL